MMNRLLVLSTPQLLFCVVHQENMFGKRVLTCFLFQDDMQQDLSIALSLKNMAQNSHRAEITSASRRHAPLQDLMTGIGYLHINCFSPTKTFADGSRCNLQQPILFIPFPFQEY